MQELILKISHNMPISLVLLLISTVGILTLIQVTVTVVNYRQPVARKIHAGSELPHRLYDDYCGRMIFDLARIAVRFLVGLILTFGGVILIALLPS